MCYGRVDARRVASARATDGDDDLADDDDRRIDVRADADVGIDIAGGGRNDLGAGGGGAGRGEKGGCKNCKLGHKSGPVD